MIKIGHIILGSLPFDVSFYTVFNTYSITVVP